MMHLRKAKSTFGSWNTAPATVVDVAGDELSDVGWMPLLELLTREARLTCEKSLPLELLKLLLFLRPAPAYPGLTLSSSPACKPLLDGCSGAGDGDAIEKENPSRSETLFTSDWRPSR